MVRGDSLRDRMFRDCSVSASLVEYKETHRFSAVLGDFETVHHGQVTESGITHMDGERALRMSDAALALLW